jgi:hypothetical protein
VTLIEEEKRAIKLLVTDLKKQIKAKELAKGQEIRDFKTTGAQTDDTDILFCDKYDCEYPAKYLYDLGKPWERFIREGEMTYAAFF